MKACFKDLLFNLILYLCNHWIAVMPSHRLRLFYYRKVMGFEIGEGTAIHMGARFLTRRRLKIGRNCVINENCVLGNRGEIEIGNCVILAPQCYLHSSDHDINHSEFPMRYGKIMVADYAFIGLRSTILKGVNLGRGCVVASGALVTRSCDDFDILAGTPAKRIGERNSDVSYIPDWSPLFH